jgi:sulfur carrier protein ThiS
LRLNVKLYGTLGRSIDGYDHLSGLDITLPEDSAIEDLLAHFKLLPDRLGIISMDGKPLKKNSRLKNGGRIKIFLPIFGG